MASSALSLNQRKGVIFCTNILCRAKNVPITYHAIMISRLYPIVDVDSLSAGRDEESLFRAICEHATELASAGATVIQYRAKNLTSREVLAHARELRRV